MKSLPALREYSVSPRSGSTMRMPQWALLNFGCATIESIACRSSPRVPGVPPPWPIPAEAHAPTSAAPNVTVIARNADNGSVIQAPDVSALPRFTVHDATLHQVGKGVEPGRILEV